MLKECRVVSDRLSLLGYLVVSLPVARKMENGREEMFGVHENTFSEIFFYISVEMTDKVIRLGCGINGWGVIAERSTLHRGKYLFSARSVWWSFPPW